MRLIRYFAFGFACILVLGIGLPLQSAKAQMQDENILASMPEGYRIAFQNRENGVTHVEMIPQGQTLENWDDMLTVQIFHNNPLSLDVFRNRITSAWFEACPASKTGDGQGGNENTYDYQFWVLACPQLAKTGRPELTMFKAIRGRDALYLVQKAFRSDVSQEALSQWGGYMARVIVCDTRREETRCPSGF